MSGDPGGGYHYRLDQAARALADLDGTPADIQSATVMGNRARELARTALDAAGIAGLLETLNAWAGTQHDPARENARHRLVAAVLAGAAALRALDTPGGGDEAAALANLAAHECGQARDALRDPGEAPDTPTTR